VPSATVAAEITEIRRQREDWQRDATKALATGRTGEAIHAYEAHGMVHAAETRELARASLWTAGMRERIAAPEQTRIILTHTNAEVRDLNLAARDRLRDAGELGEDVRVSAERGAREFASGDRIMFLKNERGLGVKNGTLGKVEQVSPERMAVRLDDGRSVAFDLKDYAHVDHGYAATIHKVAGRDGRSGACAGDPRHGPPFAAYVGCRGIVTGCSSIMAATTSPIKQSLSARCRASGRRIWRPTMAVTATPRRVPSPIGADWRARSACRMRPARQGEIRARRSRPPSADLREDLPQRPNGACSRTSRRGRSSARPLPNRRRGAACSTG
jgi:hypothetical protein